MPVGDDAGAGIEAVQAYWDARPCNIRHSPKPVGSREYFDEVEARKHFVEPHIPGFAQFKRWQASVSLKWAAVLAPPPSISPVPVQSTPASNSRIKPRADAAALRRVWTEWPPGPVQC